MKKLVRALTDDEQQKLTDLRRLAADELPDLIAKDRLRHKAAQEKTLSGALRRLIHANGQTVDQIANRVGIEPLLLDEFLTGEKTLPSDVLDRVAEVLNCETNLVAAGAR
jgi:hypothetical protein